MISKALALDIGSQLHLKPGQGISSFEEYDTIGGFISSVLPNIYTFAGIVLFIILIVGGFMFILGSGSDDPKKAETGKQAITASLIGFLIIFASFWIIRIIEIVTGLEIFSSGV